MGGGLGSGAEVQGLDYQRNVQRTEIASDRQGEVQGLEMGLRSDIRGRS